MDNGGVNSIIKFPSLWPSLWPKHDPMAVTIAFVHLTSADRVREGGRRDVRAETHLTMLRGTGLMLNIVVGAGLLALPGLTVAVAGDQALWAWLVCAIAATPLLLVFVILGGRYPDAGGIAHFVRLAFGEAGYIAASLIFLGAVVFGLPAIALTTGHYIAAITGGAPAQIAAGIVVLAALTLTSSPDIAARLSTVIASTILVLLLADSLNLLNIEAMLSIAGQNFFILYGLAGVALLKQTSRRGERAVATLATLVVIGLLIAEDPVSLLYPFGLALVGIVGWSVRRRTRPGR